MVTVNSCDGNEERREKVVMEGMVREDVVMEKVLLMEKVADGVVEGTASRKNREYFNNSHTH